MRLNDAGMSGFEKIIEDQVNALDANSFGTSPVLDEKREWKTRRELGGGALFDLAIHHFDLWRFVLGAEVAEVFALTRSERADDQSAVEGACSGN